MFGASETARAPAGRLQHAEGADAPSAPHPAIELRATLAGEDAAGCGALLEFHASAMGGGFARTTVTRGSLVVKTKCALPASTR